MSNFLSIVGSLGNQRMEDIGVLSFIFTILFALIAAFIFSWLYNYFFERRATGSQINRAFPLLSISITVIFITIQFSLPLSLGLLGALSIVRFRTPVKEAEEIGFIMLVVASSLSCATFNFIFPALLVCITFVALYTSEKLSLFSMSKLGGGMITVRGIYRKGIENDLVLIEKDIKKVLKNTRLHSLSKTEEFTATFIFNGTDKAEVHTLLADIVSTHSDFDFHCMINRNTIF